MPERFESGVTSKATPQGDRLLKVCTNWGTSNEARNHRKIEARANAALAAEIRAFRPDPISNLSDKQLVWVVGRSRRWASEFGVNDSNVVKHWVMVDTLLTPCFFTMPMVAQHFQQAFGDADTKARDILQLIKVTLRENGCGSEVWW